MNRSNIVSGLVLAGALAGVVPATAATYVVPATACSGFTATNDARLNRWKTGAVALTGTPGSGALLDVSCPITRHNGAANITSNLWVRYFGHASNPQNIDCVLWLVSNGDLVDSESGFTSSSGFGSFTIAASNLSYVENASYMLDCRFYPGDELTSFRYSEP